MFDYIFEWIRKLACYMVLVTAFIQIVPGNDYKNIFAFLQGSYYYSPDNSGS
ncbi:MAG: hypothetical protein V8S08_13625 [Lachnoclostridium sp.]